MRTYTHEELVNQRDAAYLEIKRLNARPDQSEEIRLLHQEIQNLHKHTTELVEQRNQLHKALKRHLEEH